MLPELITVTEDVPSMAVLVAEIVPELFTTVVLATTARSDPEICPEFVTQADVVALMARSPEIVPKLFTTAFSVETLCEMLA